MSGVRRPQGPRFRTKVKWGPSQSWYCCERLMQASELGNGDHVRLCRHCGVAIVVDGSALVRHLRDEPVPAHPPIMFEQERLPV